MFVLTNKKAIVDHQIPIPGYTMKPYQYGVMQYSNDKALVYLKPEVPFYAADHHPRLCWKGSGYRFNHEKKAWIEGHEIVTAQLTNDAGDMLYAAYWFQCEGLTTASELVWRWHSLYYQRKYRMISIAAGTESNLRQEVRKWLKGQF